MDLLNFEVARDYLGVLLQGLWITVALTLSVIIMSAVFAIPVLAVPASTGSTACERGRAAVVQSSPQTGDSAQRFTSFG